jgi:putative flippase GtrA
MSEFLKPGRLIRFALVGVSTAALFLLLVFLLHESLGINVVVASTTACIATLVYNYNLHYRWTFRASAPHGQAMLRFLVMSGCSVIINAILMYAATEVFVVHWLVAQISTGAVMVAWNLVLSSLWVYRE